MPLVLEKKKEEPRVLKMLDKTIERSFSIPPVQYHADNKKLISVQNVMESGADCLVDPQGLIVGAYNGMPIYAEVEAGGITIGNPGSGKTVAAATTNLLFYPGSVVSLEIGGATFKRTYNERKWTMGQDIYIFDPQNIVGMGCSNYNPMDDLDPGERDFYSRILTMAGALISDASGHKEQNPYFRENPSGILAAMIVYLKLADSIPYEHKNFVYMAEIFSEFPSAAWNEHISVLKNWQGPHKRLLRKFGNYLSTAESGDQNMRSVVSATSQWLDKWMADDDLGQHMTSSDFSMMDLRNKKATLYIIMPSVDEYINYQPWLRLILQSAIDSTPNPGDGGKAFKQEDRILFMLDELTQLGHLQAVATGAQTVRQKGIIFWSLFQSYASLRDVYGEEQASAFMNSAEAIQFLRNHDSKTIEYISKRLGRYMVYVPTVSEGQGIQIGVGKQKSIAKGIVNQNTWQVAVSESVGRMDQITNTHITTLTNSHSDMSSPGGTSSGSSGSTSTSHGTAKTQGKSTQDGKTNSEGGGSAESETTQTGSNNNEGWNNSHTFSYVPVVIDCMDARQIEDYFSNKKQILFFNGREQSHCTLDRQARYYEIPFLRERAEGPPIPKAPAFPDPPKKTVVRLTPMPPVDLEGFNLDESKLSWIPPNPVAWTAPAKLSEWGQGVKESCEKFLGARYRLDKFNKETGFFDSFFRTPYVKAATVAGVATTCYIGGSIMAVGITFGALILTGMAVASWKQHKLIHDKFFYYKVYTDMRCAAIKMVRDQLEPIMEAHDTTKEYMKETVERQHELVAGNGKMESTLAGSHETLTKLLEEHRANLVTCRNLFGEIRSGAVSGWSSGDWVRYVKKLKKYKHVREKFFDFFKGDYLVQPPLVTPTKLGPPQPRTLTSRMAPMPEMFEAKALAPEVSQELAALPEEGTKTRKELEAYFDTPLTGYDLPDDIKTVGDAVNRRAELTNSTRRRDKKDVMLLDAALESIEDPHLEKFDGLVRGYVTGLRADEDSYHDLLRKQIHEGQKNVMDTIGKIRQFNRQVMRLNDAQVSFEGFARRLDEARAAAHHRAHARAIRDMEDMERAFDAQSERLRIRGPLVPPKLPRQRPALKAIQPPK